MQLRREKGAKNIRRTGNRWRIVVCVCEGGRREMIVMIVIKK